MRQAQQIEDHFRTVANDNWLPEKIAPYRTRLRVIVLLTAGLWAALAILPLVTPPVVLWWLLGSVTAGPLAVWLSPRWRGSWGKRFLFMSLAWPITLPAAAVRAFRYRKHQPWRKRDAKQLAKGVVTSTGKR